MGIRFSRGRGKSGTSGPVGCGFFLLIAVLLVGGVASLIFPKLPGYDEAMEQGEVVPGQVVRIETVENIAINDQRPRRVRFRYGDQKEGSMMLAMDEKTPEGQSLKIRVLGDHAYPEDLRPLRRPGWLTPVLIAGAMVASLFLGFGILRLLVIGGVVFAAGRSMWKKKDEPPPPPPPPPAA